MKWWVKYVVEVGQVMYVVEVGQVTYVHVQVGG